MTVHVFDLHGKRFTYSDATFAAHPDGDLVITNERAEGDLGVWARGQWQRAEIAR